MFVFFGASAVIISHMDYQMGTAGRMGPGYFPFVLGILLTVLGLASVIRSLFRPGEKIEKFAIKQTILVLAGIVLFGLIVRGAGMVVAIIALAVISMYASEKFSWKHALPFAAGACVFCVLIFVTGLKLPLPIIGSWFGF